MLFFATPIREVAEWLKAHAWKACLWQHNEGSNPFLSAFFILFLPNFVMRFYLSILALFMTLSSFAQQEVVDFDAVDSLYREDQFYFNFTYNNLRNTPDGFRQNKFSSGLAIGFLRDMPFNKRRTWSVAAGLGYSFAVYNQNLVIDNTSGSNIYQLTGSDITYFSKDKLSLHFIDLPVEIRWRNSTPESHKFWRVYTGLKLSYLFYDQYKLVSSEATIKSSNNTDLNKLHYGCYLAIGYNTWNIYAYYGLNSIFKSSAKIDDESIAFKTVNFGMMFYIL